MRKTVGYVLVCFVSVLTAIALSGCTKSSGTLSPARSIAGTWKASSAITVYYTTNCNSNSIYNYKTFQCIFTFVITAINDNDVTVDISGNVYNVTNEACGEAPPVAGGYPITFSGTVSSSQLTLTDYIYSKNTSGAIVAGNFVVGSFDFTSNLMGGSIDWLQYYDGVGDAIGWSTDKISLTKQ